MAEQKKGKIHEVVAVEKDVKTTVAKIVEETNTTFTKKHQLFSTHSKYYEALNQGDLEKPDEEMPQPITTVGEKLSYFENHLIKLFDIILQKEEANSRAVEDIIVYVDETPVVIAEKVPVSALVQLENWVEQIRKQVYDVIPTLDPVKYWDADTAAGIGKYKSKPIERQRSLKIPKPLVLHPGSDKHPPQVQLIQDDVPVGTWITTYYSGLISPADKSLLLSRLDLVLGGIKKARSRANETPVNNLHIGKKLFKFVNEGKI